MTVAVEVLGIRIEVCLPDNASTDLRDRVEAAWHHCLADPTQPTHQRVHMRSPDPRAGMHVLSQDVTRTAIDALAGRAFMLHAAALADSGSGAAIAVVGGSGAGKTTWARTHGVNRRYLSDETVWITDDLRVFGIAKPLSLGHRGVKEQVAPGNLGLLKARGTEHLVGLWLLDRNGTTPARYTAVDLLDALPLLAPQASYLAALERPLQQMASIVSACGGLRRVEYREADELADLVAEALA